MRSFEKMLVVCGVALGAFLFGPIDAAEARPNYFDALTTYYGIAPGANLDACGVCHFKWNGTGQRNPYGSTVEQQLYLGKSITQSLIDSELTDSDMDGFTNGDEIMIHETLPGYSCDNYFLAIDNPPVDYHTYCVPFVATCLVPIDIRLNTNIVGSFGVEVGTTEIYSIEIFNNGSTFPINVSSADFQAGASPDYSLVGPTAPFAIPVGESVIVDIVFSPTTVGFHNAVLEIESDDPDEPSVYVNASSVGFIKVLAPEEDRHACLSDVSKQYAKYTKTHLREWNRCYLDEVAGRACDTGRRDAKILSAESRFRSRVGGSKDKACKGNSLTASLLDMPTNCEAPCDSIVLTSINSLATCLICQQDAAMEQELTDALGTAPPDLPANSAGSVAAESCQKKVLSGMAKAVGTVQKTLGRCELENIIAVSPTDCAVAGAEKITKAQSKVDAAVDKCSDTTGLEGCRFEMSPDPACLGASALSIGDTLVDTTFGIDD